MLSFDKLHLRCPDRPNIYEGYDVQVRLSISAGGTMSVVNYHDKCSSHRAYRYLFDSSDRQRGSTDN